MTETVVEPEAEVEREAEVKSMTANLTVQVKRTAAATAAGAIVLLSAPALVHAEPYMALREGYACADCHVNRSGGGMRNVTVEAHAGQILHLPNAGKGVFGTVDERFSPRLSDWLSIGTDLRVVDEVLFQDDPDANGEVKNNTAFREPQSHDVDIDQATVYGEVRLVPDKLSIYVDERFAPGGADNREAFGLLDGVLPAQTYVKGGRFFPAWGLKLQDDEAFVSAQTGFSFDRSVTGVEVGRSAEGLSWFVSAAEATEDDDLDLLVTASSYYLWTDVGPITSIMLGASAAHDEPGDAGFDAFTAFGGMSVGPLALLGQGALVDADRAGEPVKTWIGYTEINWLFADWINAKLAFDWSDPDDDLDEDERNRISVGLEPFLDHFLQLRIFYRVLNGPEDRPDQNRDELALEAHVFF